MSVGKFKCFQRSLYMPLYSRKLAGHTGFGPLPHLLRHPFANYPGCNKLASCPYLRMREIMDGLKKLRLQDVGTTGHGWPVKV